MQKSYVHRESSEVEFYAQQRQKPERQSMSWDVKLQKKDNVLTKRISDYNTTVGVLIVGHFNT